MYVILIRNDLFGLERTKNMAASTTARGVSQPAPGELELIRAFVNTNDIDAHHDLLTSPASLRTWFTEHHLLDVDAPVTHADLQRILNLREAFRVLLLTNNGVEMNADAPKILNHLAGSINLIIQFDQNGQVYLKPSSSGIDGAIGHILNLVLIAILNGSWTRLKACRNDTCHWAFYDTSKNRSATWCTMAVCGSRLKARAYRQRHRS